MILVILLICHLLADFFFQSSKLSEMKQKSFKHLLLHSVIYLLVFCIGCFIFLNVGYAVLTVLITAVTHFIIDLIRAKIDNHTKNHTVRFASFLTDQILHIGIILTTYYLLNLNLHQNRLYSKCAAYPEFNKIMLYGLLFLILLQPSAIFIKKLFAFLFKDNAEQNDTNQNAGNMIGKLERVITSILLLCDQYGVIGLVLTAKSIARFKQLEEKDFAEKYLIGTLTSIAISLIATLIIKSLI